MRLVDDSPETPPATATEMRQAWLAANRKRETMTDEYQALLGADNILTGYAQALRHTSPAGAEVIKSLTATVRELAHVTEQGIGDMTVALNNWDRQIRDLKDAEQNGAGE